MTPRVFVGTMSCGEGDLEECLFAIDKQKGVVTRHVVISGRPEKVAHNELWASWRAAKHEHDMFVKVDADTVLAHDEVLLEFWRMMEANPRITGIQAPLADYFTDSHINGLNCFSPRVTFRDTVDGLFCDRHVDVDHDVVVKAAGVVERLRPAGYHCFHVTDVQAFHFGLHRALKGQDHVIAQVKDAWRRHGDRHRALALMGASCAGSFRGTDGFNYADERFLQAFNAVQAKYAVMLQDLKVSK